MDREDRKRIQSWTENELKSGDGFLETCSLVINVRKECVTEAKVKSDFDESDFFDVDGDWFIIESPPIFAHDIYPKSLMEWACSFWKLKPEWVEEVSIQD